MKKNNYVKTLSIIFFLFGTLFAFSQAGKIFDSADDAAESFLQNTNQASINENAEMGVFIYKNDEGYFYGKTVTGNEHDMDNVDWIGSGALDLSLGNAVGFAHTHGAESGDDYLDNELSGTDVNSSIGTRLPIYGGFPNGTASKFDPHSGATTENFNTSPLPFDSDYYLRAEGDYFDSSDYDEF